MVTNRTSSPTLVGRHEELDELTRLLEQVTSGRAACALIAGEAGIGKTRLVGELAQQATAVGADVLVGRCVDLRDDVLPYAPFVEVLTDLLHRDGAPALRALAGPTADELCRLVPAVGGDTTPPSTASTGRLLLAVESVLEGLAASRPVLLVVEDVQWADASTRDLLVLLAHQLRGRVLLVATLRTDEPADLGGGPRHLLSGLERAALRVELQPLSREAQALQLSGLLGQPPSPDLLERVYRRAEGNPFFAEQLLALGSAESVPSTVRELLLARLRTLAPVTQQVLRAAAAAGRRVGHELLEAVADQQGEALEDALRAAVDSGMLVVERPSELYAFRHALLHEAISSSLLPGESVRLNRRLAEALTAQPRLAADASHAVAGRIALHWYAAGNLERTVSTSVAAATEAEHALAFPEALRHYERAIGLLDEVAGADDLLDEPRYRLLWRAADVAHLAAHPDRAAALAREAIAAVDPAQTHHRAYLHERLGRYLWMAADGQSALAQYERAVELCPVDVSCWRAAILSGYSQILMLSGRFRESRTWAHAAMEIAGKVDNGRSTEGHARNNLGVSLAMLGDVDAGVEQLLLSRRIAEEVSEDVDDIARAIVNLHSVLFDAGRTQEAADVSLAGIDVVDRLGLQRRKGVWCRCDAAEALLVLGRCTEASRLVAEAVALAPAAIDAVRAEAVRGQVAVRQGDMEAATQILTSAWQRGAHVMDGHLKGPLAASLVEALRGAGEPASGLRFALESLPGLDGESGAPYVMHLLAQAVGAAADVATAAGRRRQVQHERAARHAERLAQHATEALGLLPALPPASAAHLLAQAELTRARARPDPQVWRTTASAWDAVGDRYRVAYAQWREAEAHVAAGSGRAAGTAAATAALRTAEDIGAERLRLAVQELAGRARLLLPRSDEAPDVERNPFRLTPREREVLELVAQGRTDRQIGGSLFISHRTVERHVSNLLAKVDASTRGELVAVAYRSGLVDAHGGAGTLYPPGVSSP